MHVEARPTGSDYGIWECVPALECIGRLKLRIVLKCDPHEHFLPWAVTEPEGAVLYFASTKDEAIEWAYEHLHKLWYGEEPVPSMFYDDGMLS